MKTNRFMYLLVVMIPLTAMTGPVYGFQKTDTIKADNKKIPEDDNEKTQPNAYHLFGYGDPKLDSLSKQLSHYSRIMQNFDNSKAYETLKARANGFSQPEPSFYNNDTLRQLMANIGKISQYFKAHSNRHLHLKRDSLGYLVGDYFKTQKFAAINSALKKKYNIEPAKNYNDNDAGYRQYHNELMKKIPAEVKNQLQELKILSIQIRDQLKSPEYFAYLKQLPSLIDSMKNYYKRPHLAQYSYASYEATMDIPKDQRRKAQDELHAYLENPEFHHAAEMLTEYGKQMHDYYLNTPAAKEREDAWKNELKTILADDYYSILHPGHGITLQ